MQTVEESDEQSLSCDSVWVNEHLERQAMLGRDAVVIPTHVPHTHTHKHTQTNKLFDLAVRVQLRLAVSFPRVMTVGQSLRYQAVLSSPKRALRNAPGVQGDQQWS